MATQAQDIREMYRDADNSQREEWLKKASENRAFFLGDQLSQDERDSLEQAGMPDFVVNKITPAVELYTYYATARNPRWRAVGREESDTEVASIHEKLNKYCWDRSKGQAMTGQVVQDCLTDGTGFFHVDVDRNADNGMGEVIFEHLDPDEIFVDPNTRDFLWRDADYIGIRKVLPKNKLKDKYPNKRSLIEQASSYDTTLDNYGSDYTETDYIEKQVDRYMEKQQDLAEYFEIYKKVKEPYVNVFFVKDLPEKKQRKLERKVQQQVEDFTKESNVRLQETLDELEKAFNQEKINKERYQLEIDKAKKQNKQRIRQFRQSKIKALKKKMGRIDNEVMHLDAWKKQKQVPELVENVIDVIKMYKDRIQLHIAVGDKKVDTYFFDKKVSEYPIVPVHYLKAGSPYGMSFVELLKGKQKEINKAHQVALHNANLGTALRWLVKEGSVDTDEWESYASSAGAILEWRGEPEDKPDPVTLPNISDGFINLARESKSEMDDLSGMIAPSNLKEEDTHKGMLMQDEYGTRRVKQWMKNNFDPAMEQVGKVFKQISQTVYSAYKVFRVSENNHTMGIEQNIEITEYELNKRIYDKTGNLKELKWNYPEAKFDIKYVTRSTMPVNRWAKMQMYFKYYEAGLIDDIAFLKMTDIQNKDEILKRNSRMKKMQQQLENLQERLKESKSIRDNLKRQLIRSGIKQNVEEAELEKEKELMDTKAKQQVVKRDMERQKVANQKEQARILDDFKKDLKNEIEEIKLEHKKELQELRNKIKNQEE